MVKFIAKRLAISVVLLFIVTTLVFAFVHMMPGDPVLTMLGVDSNPDPVTVEKIRTELGLDQPILVQYGNYLKGIVKLDLGKSYSEKIPVVQAIASRFPRTLELAFVSLVLACLAGIPLGIIAAVRRGKLSDLMLTTVASVGTSVPGYVLGSLLVVVFALNIFNLPIAKLPARRLSFLPSHWPLVWQHPSCGRRAPQCWTRWRRNPSGRCVQKGCRAAKSSESM